MPKRNERVAVDIEIRLNIGRGNVCGYQLTCRIYTYMDKWMSWCQRLKGSERTKWNKIKHIYMYVYFGASMHKPIDHLDVGGCCTKTQTHTTHKHSPTKSPAYIDLCDLCIFVKRWNRERRHRWPVFFRLVCAFVPKNIHTHTRRRPTKKKKKKEQHFKPISVNESSWNWNGAMSVIVFCIFHLYCALARCDGLVGICMHACSLQKRNSKEFSKWCHIFQPNCRNCNHITQEIVCRIMSHSSTQTHIISHAHSESAFICVHHKHANTHAQQKCGVSLKLTKHLTIRHSFKLTPPPECICTQYMHMHNFPLPLSPTFPWDLWTSTRSNRRTRLTRNVYTGFYSLSHVL